MYLIGKSKLVVIYRKLHLFEFQCVVLWTHWYHRLGWSLWLGQHWQMLDHAEMELREKRGHYCIYATFSSVVISGAMAMLVLYAGFTAVTTSILGSCTLSWET